MIIKKKIPCTKNNDNKDKKYLEPRLMMIKIKKIPTPRIIIKKIKKIPCTKNNDNKDNKYLPPIIIIKGIKNLAPRIIITMIKKYLVPRLMMKKIKNTPCTQQYHRYPNVVIIIIVPCTSSDQ